MTADNDCQPPQAKPPRTRRRVPVALVIQVTFLCWVIYAGVSAPQSGPSPGVGPQMGLWAAADVIFAVIYGICQLPRGPH